MTEAEQIEALKENLEHWQHKFDELAAENDRLRAELEAIRLRVPSDEEVAEWKDKNTSYPQMQNVDALQQEMRRLAYRHGASDLYSWMRDRIFPNQNK